MLFYFQFNAQPRNTSGESYQGEMLFHALVDADNIDQAAERVVGRMSSLYVKIGDVRRACILRDVEEMAHEPHLLKLYQGLDPTGYAFLVELPNGGEAIGGVSVGNFVDQKTKN